MTTVPLEICSNQERDGSCGCGVKTDTARFIRGRFGNSHCLINRCILVAAKFIYGAGIISALSIVLCHTAAELLRLVNPV